MKYILVVILALAMFLPVKADSLTTVSLVARGVTGAVCFSGTITTPLAGGEIGQFCTDATGVASIQLPTWVTYRLVESVPAGYAVSGIACVGASRYRTSGASVTINVQDSGVTCTFDHVRRQARGFDR